jgi:hypothetical protein
MPAEEKLDQKIRNSTPAFMGSTNLKWKYADN